MGLKTENTEKNSFRLLSKLMLSLHQFSRNFVITEVHYVVIYTEFQPNT